MGMKRMQAPGKRPPEGIGSTGQTIRDRINLAAVATGCLAPPPAAAVRVAAVWVAVSVP